MKRGTEIIFMLLLNFHKSVVNPNVRPTDGLTNPCSLRGYQQYHLIIPKKIVIW